MQYVPETLLRLCGKHGKSRSHRRCPKEQSKHGVKKSDDGFVCITGSRRFTSWEFSPGGEIHFCLYRATTFSLPFRLFLLLALCDSIRCSNHCMTAVLGLNLWPGSRSLCVSVCLSVCLQSPLAGSSFRIEGSAFVRKLSKLKPRHFMLELVSEKRKAIMANTRHTHQRSNNNPLC